MRKDVEIVAEVTAHLSAWSGYAVFRELMERLPDLQVYTAGGAVRDALLGRRTPPRDFDLFLTGRSAEDVVAELDRRGTVKRGPFGSPRWFPGADERYCDVLIVEQFYNGLWRCQDLLDVLNQFDFTGNAVGFRLGSTELIDPQNGRRDLACGVMRAVRFDYPDEPISPGQPFHRPEVVWFRILHYASALDLSIEPVTQRWLDRNAAYAENAERFERTFFPLHPGSLERLSPGRNG